MCSFGKHANWLTLANGGRDILEIAMSANNNRYLLVVQDLFKKMTRCNSTSWPDSCMHYWITDQVIYTIWSPRHFVFRSRSKLWELYTLTGINKSWTTAYHPESDGMIEWFNRPLLQLLRTNVALQSDWGCYLPIVLYAYRTTVHSATGVTPFLQIFSHRPKPYSFSSPYACETLLYPI